MRPACALAEGERAMNWIKSNAMPLLVGAAVGYFIARSGGLGGAVAKVKSKA